MCWTFQVCEGDLEDLYWTYSFDELIKRIQLKYGEAVTVQLGFHNSLVQVVSAALGGPSESKPNIVDLPADPEMGIAHLNRFLTFG